MEGKKKKPFYKRWWFIVIAVIVILGAIGSMGEEKDNSANKDAVPEQPTNIGTTEQPKTKEVVEPAKEEPKEPVKEVYVNTAESVELFTGKFEVGKDLKAGRYLITCEAGSGNLFIYEGEMPYVNEILTSSADESLGMGVTKIEIDIKDKDTIQISGINKVFFDPATIELKTTLGSGNYLVGRDVPAGDYIATAPEGSGNFFVYSKSGYPEVNEILGKDDYGMAVEKVKFSVKDGQEISIRAIETVILE